jgi:hypothetical protein
VRKVSLIVLAGVLVGALVGVVLAAGGGGGDDSSTNLRPPDLGVPTQTTQEPDAETGATGPQETPAPSTGTGGQQQGNGGTGNGGTGGGQTGGNQAPAQPDTERHDTAPPKGSPADRFEQFCKDNPGAC